MQFKKTLLVGIEESALDKPYWDKLDSLSEKRKHISKESSDLHQELKNTDCLLVNFGVAITKEDIDIAPNLKYIGTLATAFGKVDIDYAAQKNIPVCNLGGYSTESVAEFVIAVILESIRSLEEGKKRGRDGNYSFEGIPANEIKGKVFGVFGLGNIGGRVAELANGMGGGRSILVKDEKTKSRSKWN